METKFDYVENLQKIQSLIRKRLEIHNVKEGTKKARLIETELLVGIGMAKEEKLELKAGLYIMMSCGRSVLSLDSNS